MVELTFNDAMPEGYEQSRSAVGEISFQQRWQMLMDEFAGLGRMIGRAAYHIEKYADEPLAQEIYRLELDRLQSVREFMRLPTAEDLTYRARLVNALPGILNNIPEYHHLRFHGTSLMATHQILEHSVISSAVDHDGTPRSMDIQGKISVTSRSSCLVTIRDYLNISKNCVPVGCVFVVLPKESEAVSSERTMTMSNVKLKDNDGTISHQLLGILCSPETLGTVQSWLHEMGYPEELAKEYFAFAREAVQEK